MKIKVRYGNKRYWWVDTVVLNGIIIALCVREAGIIEWFQTSEIIVEEEIE